MAKGEVSSRGGNRGNVGPADWEGVLKVEGNLSFFFHIFSYLLDIYAVVSNIFYFHPYLGK